MKTKTQIQKEIKSKLLKNPHGLAIIAQRVGKTKICIDLIKRDKPKSILWVILSKDLHRDIMSEFKKWKADKYTNILTISTYNSLPKITGHYETIILDEVQSVTEINMSNILNGNLTYKHILGVSGTYTKSLEKQEIYKKLNLEVLIDYGINEAVEDGVLSDYRINVVNIPYNPNISKEVKHINQKIEYYNKGIISYLDGKISIKGMVSAELNVRFNRMVEDGKLFNILSDTGKSIGYIISKPDGSKIGKFNPFPDIVYYIKNEKLYQKVPAFLLIKRAQIIGNSPQKEQYCRKLQTTLKGKRNIFFCNSIQQSESISEYLYNSTTDTKYLDMFNNMEISELVMVNSGSVGYTYRQVDNLIIVQVDSDNNGKSSQKLSRILLKQIDYQATVWILCLKGTQDEAWVQEFLKTFNQDKINVIE